MPDILKDAPLFQGIPLDGLSALAQQGRTRRFVAGQVLIRQGEPSDVMYVIAQGRVRVERSHPALTEPVALNELGAGETVGEMGLLDGGPRSATVVALEDTEALELTASAVAATLVEFPQAARSLLYTLSSRLRSTDELVAEATRREKEAARR